MVYVRKSSKRWLKPLTLMIEVMEVCPREGHVRRCRGNQSVDCWAEIRLRLLGRLQTRTNLIVLPSQKYGSHKVIIRGKIAGERSPSRQRPKWLDYKGVNGSKAPKRWLLKSKPPYIGSKMAKDDKANLITILHWVPDITAITAQFKNTWSTKWLVPASL